jgi:hypothetical protein
MRKRGYAVIVVAEGAGADIMPPTGHKDESGNVVLPDIGAFLSHKLTAHFKTQVSFSSSVFLMTIYNLCISLPLQCVIGYTSVDQIS